MAINVQKFLPQAKTTSAIVKANVTPSLTNKEYDGNKLVSMSKQYNEQNVNLVRKSLLDIDALIKSLLTNDQQSERSERLKKERKQRDEVETKLEAPQERKKFNLPTISIPGTSFLDRIKKFLFFTSLGFLFNTFQNQLPRLKKIFVAIGKVYNVAETIFKFILESIVGFIDKAYGLYDKVRETVKIIGGEGAQKTFDQVSSNLNKYINYVLIGGMALTGAIEAFATNVRNYKPPTPTSRPSSGSGGRPRVTTSGGRPAQGLDVRSPLRQRPTITTSGGEVLSGAAKKQAGKNLFRIIKAPLSKLPIVGSLIEFGISWALGDSVSKAAFRGVGNLLVGAVGLAIGGPIGAAVGGIVGGELGGKLYEILFQNKKPPQSVQRQQSGGKVINIRRYASGGQVIGREGRTLRLQKKTPSNILPQQTQPGKDVGGEKEIQRLYPDSVKPEKGNPWITAILGRERLTITNPFRTLETVANTFKRIPYGIGALMGGAIDAALGQKISEGTLNSIATGLESLFENINSENYGYYEKMFSKKNEIPAMASGGVVERTGGIVATPEFNPKKLIIPYIESAVGQVIETVRRELSLGKETPKEEKELKDDTSTAIRQPSPSADIAASGTDIGGMVVGYVGSTGRSSGPHIHIETGDGYSGAGGTVPDYVLNNIIVDGKPLSSHPKGDGLGAGRGHRGFDYPIRSGAPITLKGGLKFVEYAEGYNAGYGNSLIVSDSSGRKYLLGHLSGGPSNPEKIKELAEKQKTQQQPPLDQTQSARISPDKAEQTSSMGKSSANSALLDFISSGEGGYNSMNQGTSGGRIVGSTHNASTILGKNLTDMTVGEIMDLQASGKLFAAGRYQIIPGTMKLAVSRSGVSRSDKFSSSVQDRLGLALIYNGQRPRLSSYLQGKSDDLRGAMVDLAEEWASVPHPDTGRSAYPPANISSHTVEEVKKALTSARVKKANKGGLLTPSSDSYIQKQPPKDKASSLTKYPSYSVEGGRKMAVQPIIQEKMVPVPIPMGGNKLTSFRVSGGVNNNTNTGLMRG